MVWRFNIPVHTQPRFTIVTPNFNMGRYLVATIESVLCNLRPGDEYFIVDGGSSDESVNIIRAYESRITGWISEPDKGYADAIAKGFKRGSGELLAWINSSDLLLPGALDCARRLLVNPTLDLIFGDDYHIDEAPDARTVANAKKHKIDLSPLRARQFVVEDFDVFDKIYVMDKSNLQNVLKLARMTSRR